jgi:GT2 family glycosyltransferase
MTAPRLTVSITTRDRPAALARCLRSLASIADLVDRAIVFDDASEPAVDGATLQSIAGAAGVRLDIIRVDRQLGTAAGKNRIAELAVTPYLLSLDDDAYVVAGDAVRSACAVLDADPAVAAVAFAQADAEGRRYPDVQQPGPVAAPAYVAAFIGFGVLIVRERLLAIGGYRAEFVIHGEEREVCLRWFHRGWRVVYLPDAPIAHVADPANRDRRAYVRYVMRNDCLAALYNDPLPRAIVVVVYKLWSFTRMRARIPGGDPGGLRWVVKEIVRAAPTVFRQRRPVSYATLRAWRSLARRPQPYTMPAVS